MKHPLESDQTRSSSFDRWAVGDEASIEHVITADDVARFVQLTGDHNPVHVDEQYAASSGFGGRVVHGMLTASYVSTLIGTVLPGPGALWLSERFNFRAPVRINDRIRVEAKVRHVSPATRVLVLDVSVRDQHGTVVLDGEAHVQVVDRDIEVTDPERSVASAVVTGSGRGIGAAIAQRLAVDGVRVVVNYRRDKDRAEQTVQAINDGGGVAQLFQADVSDQDQASALIAFATDAFGPVDALVNNAGGPTNPRSLDELTWDEMQAHISTHLKGSFLCVDAVLPGMVERGFGRIVNMTSQAAYGTPPPKMTGYVVAKAALAAYTRCLALEAGPHGVTANAVAPGMVDTELVAHVAPRQKMTIAAQTPMRRLATLTDVADVVSFLLGPQAGYVTGQTIHLSGGITG